MIAAFFDVDGTLARTNVLLPLLWFQRTHLPRRLYRLWLCGLMSRVPLYLLIDRLDRATFLRWFYRRYTGLDAKVVRQWHEVYFEGIVRPLLFSDGLERVRWHQGQGHRVILVTGELDFVAAPLGRSLNADWLAPKLLERDGKLTGELAGELMVGKGKAEAIRRYAQEWGIDLSQSFAYGDDFSDALMLRCVGHPVAVNPDRRLRRLAEQQGWRIVTWR